MAELAVSVKIWSLSSNLYMHIKKSWEQPECSSKVNVEIIVFIQINICMQRMHATT